MLSASRPRGSCLHQSFDQLLRTQRTGEAPATINHTLVTELFSRWRLCIRETVGEYYDVASSLYL